MRSGHKVFVRQNQSDKYVESDTVSFKNLPHKGLRVRVVIDEAPLVSKSAFFVPEKEMPQKVDVYVVDDTEMTLRYYKPSFIEWIAGRSGTWSEYCSLYSDLQSPYDVSEEAKVFMTRVGYEGGNQGSNI